MCDIHLLYIDPGVFGELRPRPSMPPVPLHIQIFESATAILPSDMQSEDVENSEGKPLNLSLPSATSLSVTNSFTKDNDTPAVNMASLDPATGNNQQALITGDNLNTEMMTTPSHYDKYADAHLSGNIERVISNQRLDELSCLIALPPLLDEPTDNNHAEASGSSELPPKFPNFSDNASASDVPEHSMKIALYA